jgi:hypothetical protein
LTELISGTTTPQYKISRKSSEVDLFHTGGQTDRHIGANSRSSQILESAYKVSKASVPTCTRRTQNWEKIRLKILNKKQSFDSYALVIDVIIASQTLR